MPHSRKEPNWIFQHRQDDWLLFRAERSADATPQRGYRSDWKAVNVSTGEVRRFTYTGVIDVWLDIFGIEKALPGEYPAWLGQQPSMGPRYRLLHLE